jgi:hypothetical protein
MSNTSKHLTAVQWLINEINKTNPEVTWALRQECSKALAMEKEQIIRAVDSDSKSKSENGYSIAEKYYNSLYSKEEGQ